MSMAQISHHNSVLNFISENIDYYQYEITQISKVKEKPLREQFRQYKYQPRNLKRCSYMPKIDVARGHKHGQAHAKGKEGFP